MTEVGAAIAKLEQRPAEAFEELVRLGERAVEPLCRLLGPPGSSRGALAAKALGYIGDPRAAPALLRMVEGELVDEISEEWVMAVRTLGRLKDARAVEPLCRFLRVADHRWSAPAKALHALETLGAIGSVRMVEPACAGLSDVTVDTANSYASALDVALRPFGQQAIPPLADQIANSKNELGRRAAILVLKGLVPHKATPTSDVVDALTSALKRPDPTTRRAAANALSHLRARAALPDLKARLRPLFGEREEFVREAIREAITRIEGSSD